MNEVYKNIFQIQVPLINNPLKELNAYLIKGEERNLLIDTGFNNEKAYNALMDGLKELNTDLNNTDVFLTHSHSDHTGLASVVKNQYNKVYMSKQDGIRTNAMLLSKYWDWYISMQKEMGFPDDCKILFEDQPAYLHRHNSAVDFTYLKHGDILNIGEFSFEVVDLKGHTPAHIGLYEPNKHLLFSGDTILAKITPHISRWDGKYDYLGCFLDTLSNVKKMKLERVFTSHRKEVEYPYERIDQIITHHQNRLHTILEILSEKESNIYNISHGVKWDFAGGNFAEFPKTQKWFAANEVYAHLLHLETIGKVVKIKDENGVFVFKLTLS